MAQPEGSQAVKVGVLLARKPGDLGEWLSDGAAFDTAGADALWIDVAGEPELDPLALTAALAAVTYRSVLVVTLPGHDEPSPALARTVTTIGQLSRGRLRILADAISVEAAADMGPGPGVVRRIPGNPVMPGDPDIPGDPEVFGCAEHGGTQRWVSTPLPGSRATWRAALLDAAERGYAGVLVPADTRLLDMLRNPDDLGDRRDLQLAQG